VIKLAAVFYPKRQDLAVNMSQYDRKIFSSNLLASLETNLVVSSQIYLSYSIKAYSWTKEQHSLESVVHNLAPKSS
jgi:hypothetical protein